MDAARSVKRKRGEVDDFQSSRPNHNPDAYRKQNTSARGWSATEQARLNKLQEEERHREFLAKEGQFVLQQKRKAAEIRIKEGRARPIDWLAINLQIIDPVEDLINEGVDQEEQDYVDSESVIEQLSVEQLSLVKNEIDDFLDVETKPGNREYWRSVKVLTKERQKGASSKAVKPVSLDIENLLRQKTYEELEKLERQINKKLDSDEPIDTDYWQELLDSLLVYKAKAKLKRISQSVLHSKLLKLRSENKRIAQTIQQRAQILSFSQTSYSKGRDPDPLLEVDASDKILPVIDEQQFLSDLLEKRRKIVAAGYIPAKSQPLEQPRTEAWNKPSFGDNAKSASLFDRDVAKGVEEDEEIFASEEHVETRDTHLWQRKYRPRKPRYFNRVQMGYEWNKYNQTHYDHDNPPPKVVQGYKFHVFYPDLIDVSKAPTYKITREGGRKKGETLAPAGEEDTCIIRFMSGPPYEDVAFRIVDRDWDYSAKYDRGFKSTFEKGILTLHFSFKKVYYRK